MSIALSASQAAAAWWRRLQPEPPDRPGDRAALARLRRADLLAAMDDPATFALFRALGHHRPDELPVTALCAGVLASVRSDAPGVHPARALGPPPGEPEGRATMSALRFRRLIEASTLDDRLTQLRRAVALADRAMPVGELAAACLDWSEARRRRWIFEYHGAGLAAPPDTPSAPEDISA